MALCLAAVVMVVFLPLCGSGWTAHAAKKMKLPKQLTVQKMTDGKWKKFRVIKFKYNSHGDVTKIESTFYWDGKKTDSETITLRYKYKNGKKISATAESSDYDEYKFKLNNAGRLVRVDLAAEMFTDAHVYTYDKNGYLKSDRYSYDDHEENAYTKSIPYKTTLKGSILKSIVKKDPKGKKTWTYNKNGSLKSFNDGSDTRKYTYKMKSGYVRTKTVQQGSEKIRIQYTNSSTTAKVAKYWKNINNDERIIISHLYDPEVFDNGDEEDHFDDDAPFIDE